MDLGRYLSGWGGEALVSDICFFFLFFLFFFLFLSFFSFLFPVSFCFFFFPSLPGTCIQKHVIGWGEI